MGLLRWKWGRGGVGMSISRQTHSLVLELRTVDLEDTRRWVRSREGRVEEEAHMQKTIPLTPCN